MKAAPGVTFLESQQTADMSIPDGPETAAALHCDMISSNIIFYCNFNVTVPPSLNAVPEAGLCEATCPQPEYRHL